jgi:hypothetical protein
MDPDPLTGLGTLIALTFCWLPRLSPDTPAIHRGSFHHWLSPPWPSGQALQVSGGKTGLIFADELCSILKESNHRFLTLKR